MDDKQIPNRTAISDSGGLLTITTSYYPESVLDPNTWFLDENTPFEAESGITLLYE